MSYNNNVIQKLNKLLKQRDKQQHFGVCLGLGLLFLPVFKLWVAVLLILLIGLIKEIWDHYYGSGFCWYDMLANALGLSLSLLIYSAH